MKGAILPDPIELVAFDPARNIRRRYSISASLDLFGMIVVETRWGRIGARGQAQRHAFADHAAAQRHIAATLRRRGTAETRIGVPYQAIAVASGPIPASQCPIIIPLPPRF
ncbi:WGR domain-containing protein [Sphingobium sp. AR-3-1]|uniref:WGR domain-containing protein n=1 Tax=Sphingobium psychrophilum TaxID=2728834 RepID=A0A7X9X031_9SPHN|nr:WGR domain-containing protein [Sphingobium psychrophilum]NML13092.1 WGR domain-containing protein [Sphingobium psychrophilum]